MKLKSLLQYIFFFGLAAFLLWYSSRGIKFSELKIYLSKANKFYLLLIVIAGYASVVFRAIRWQILIEPLGKRPGFWNTFFSILIGYGVNYATPRMGEIVRCGVLSKYENVGADKLAGTMIAERFIDLISLVLVVLLGVVIEFNTVKDYFKENILGALENKLGPHALLIIAGIIIFIMLVIFFVIKKVTQSKDENKFMHIVKNVSAGFTSVFAIKNLNAFIFHSVAIWVMYLSMAYLGFKAMDSTSTLSVGAALSVLSLGSVGMIVTPGGTGAYQLLVSNLLAQLYLIPKTDAFAYAMLSWLIQTGILVIGTAIALVLLPAINKSK